MKHLFVPYEIAVMAKEKGFNDPCLAYTNKRDKEVYMWNDVLTIDECSNEYFNNGQIALPLYQQLIDYFREKRQLQIEIQTPDGSKGKWSATLHRVNGYGSVLQVNDKETYYDAFNEIIEKTFKLI